MRGSLLRLICLYLTDTGNVLKGPDLLDVIVVKLVP